MLISLSVIIRVVLRAINIFGAFFFFLDPFPDRNHQFCLFSFLINVFNLSGKIFFFKQKTVYWYENTQHCSEWFLINLSAVDKHAFGLFVSVIMALYLMLSAVQVRSEPVVWLKLYSMSHMGKEMERNWTSIYPTSTLWVRTCIVAPHTVILQVQSWYRINRPHPLSFRCPPCCLHTWRLLAVSQVCAVAGISTFLTIIRFLGHSFWVFVVTQQRGVWVHGCSAHW